MPDRARNTSQATALPTSAGPAVSSRMRFPRPTRSRPYGLWGPALRTLGSGTKHFRERSQALWGSGPPLLGYGAKHFGLRGQALWVTGPSTLGRHGLWERGMGFGRLPRALGSGHGLWGPLAMALGSGAMALGSGAMGLGFDAMALGFDAMGFGLRDRALWVTAPLPLGNGTKHWPIWGSGPGTLGFDTAHFGVRHRSLWGPAPLTLGSGTAHFGVRHRSLWGPAPLTLGSGFRAEISPKSLILGALSKAAVRLDLLTLFELEQHQQGTWWCFLSRKNAHEYVA